VIDLDGNQCSASRRHENGHYDYNRPHRPGPMPAWGHPHLTEARSTRDTRGVTADARRPDRCCGCRGRDGRTRRRRGASLGGSPSESPVRGALPAMERRIARVRRGSGGRRGPGGSAGRPSVMTPEKIKVARDLYQSRHLTVEEIAKTIGVSRKTPSHARRGCRRQRGHNRPFLIRSDEGRPWSESIGSFPGELLDDGPHPLRM
jgi:hypothetical protein